LKLTDKEIAGDEMAGNRLKTVENAFRNYFQQQGWSILKEKEMTHGIQKDLQRR
jgi:hypothetical protein